MTPELVALIAAIPDLVKLGQELMSFIIKASNGDPVTYIKNLGETMSKLNAAQTEEERQNAAHEIARAISGL